MKKRFLIALVLFLLLTTYNFNTDFNLNSKFNIEKIIIENNSILKKEEIEKDLSFLYKKNIFSINSKNIYEQLSNKGFIESFELKKIYPNKLKIKVFEKNPIVILQNKKKKFYYTDKGHIVNFTNLKRFRNLPVVFGDKENFTILLSDLKKTNFPTNEIKTFYFFDSKRWDLITIKNQTLKLPIENYSKSLKNFMDIYKQDNFDKFKIFDYRINSQLILK